MVQQILDEIMSEFDVHIQASSAVIYVNEIFYCNDYDLLVRRLTDLADEFQLRIFWAVGFVDSLEDAGFRWSESESLMIRAPLMTKAQMERCTMTGKEFCEQSENDKEFRESQEKVAAHMKALRSTCRCWNARSSGQ